MKAKSLIALFVVVSILLVYSMICYNLLNTRIQVDTRYIIDNYLQTNYPEIETYEYVKAVSTESLRFMTEGKLGICPIVAPRGSGSS